MSGRRRLPVWYLGLVATSGALRLMELRRSSQNERAIGASGRPAAGHFGAMVALHAGLHLAPLAEVIVFRRRARLPWLWVGVLASATALRWWSIASLGGAWNGRGAVPDSLQVVTTGPYRYIRHPNYVAVAADFLALPLAGGAWISALVLTRARRAPALGARAGGGAAAVRRACVPLGVRAPQALHPRDLVTADCRHSDPLGH